MPDAAIAFDTTAPQTYNIKEYGATGERHHPGLVNDGKGTRRRAHAKIRC